MPTPSKRWNLGYVGCDHYWIHFIRRLLDQSRSKNRLYAWDFLLFCTSLLPVSKILWDTSFYNRIVFKEARLPGYGIKSSKGEVRKVRELLDIKILNTLTIGSNSISLDEAEEVDRFRRSLHYHNQRVLEHWSLNSGKAFTNYESSFFQGISWWWHLCFCFHFLFLYK